ncbi:hypothetical protein B0I35DRAFT_475227 [Stachybotrys elegans]|uniref:Uncharacterized protein n=1 Tax=Stachybotrys elegans TaxID=80388 RepID=A0A8K0WVV5_9HYPO|nr:hypothetical protein B0I35DRAFT_475227 [Stachybotrys elegans]
MGRPSVSSDTSSTALSEATTACSYTKPALDDSASASAGPGAAAAAAAASDSEAKRRGLRQRARELVADMGHPPTKRHDAKHGKVTKNYSDLGVLGAAILTRQSAI